MKKPLRNILHPNPELIGINQRNLQLVYPNNPRKFFHMVNDKVTTKQLLVENGIPVPETYSVVEHSWEISQALENIEAQQSFVVKPSNGSGGKGILILEKDINRAWETPGGRSISIDQLRMHIASIVYGAFGFEKADKCIMEQRIVPHPFFSEIYPSGVPDIRIIFLKGEPMMAMLRIPTRASGGKANLHQGALGTGIDMESGSITQGHYRKKFIHHHPDSGTGFHGLKIPYWNTCLEIGVAASGVVPLDYLGVDIIIDEQFGPLIIELNARPGLQIQNANRKGLGHYLK